MCGPGGQTQTSTVSIPPEVLENYRKVFARGEQIAQKPFQAYSKDPNAFVAGMTPTQQASLENINAIQGMASGDVAQGQGMIGRGVGQGSDLQRASLGTAAEGQGVGSQLFGKSLGTSEAGLGAAAQIYGQAMPSIARGTAVGERYGSDAARNLYSGIAQAQPYMGEAAGLTRSGLGVGQQYAGLASDYLGAGTQDVGVGSLDTERYMSPYLNQVVRAQQALQAEENEAQRSALKGQAIRSGAFGGDRAGVAQANLARQQSLANQATLSNILQQGYGQAQGVAGQQQQLGLGAAQANRAAQQFGAQQAAAMGQQQFGQNLSAAQQQAALGQALYGQNIGQGQAIAGLGQQQYAQGLGTAQATAGMGKDIYGMSNQQAQLQQAAANGMFGQAAQMAALQQGAGNNIFNYGLQGGQGIANLGLANQQAQMQSAQAQMQMGQIQQQTDQAGKTALYNQFTQQQGFPYQQAQFLANLAMGTGALSGSTTTTNSSGGGFFSDRRMKDNAEKIGETFDGKPIYRYNYKGDNRTQIGLMAQDVEKDNPKAVGSSQGYKTLDYKKATDEAAERGHFYSGGLVPAAMGGAVGPENAYEGYARGGYALGGYTSYTNEEGNTAFRDDEGRTLSYDEYQEKFYGDKANGGSGSEKEKAASNIDPRINQFYQESMFRDADPEGAKYWQQQLDRGASIEDVRSQIAGSRERNLVNQAPLTYDASKFADYAAPVRNRYGSASAPAGSYASSFQTQPVDPQASGKGPSTGQQMGGYSGYQQPMGYGQQQASGKGPQSGMYGGGYQQPSQMSQFNQGYGQGYMGGYQPMQQPQASGKGVGPSSYQSNYGYSNPYGMGSSSPQASGKGPSSSGGGASGFRDGGRIGYARGGGGHLDPNDLAAIASQRMMELAPHAAGMPGQTIPGAQSYVSNKMLHVPKLVTSNVPPPRQEQGGLQTAMAHAERVNKLGSMFSGKGTFGEESTMGKAGRKIIEGAKGAFTGAASPDAAPAPSADAPAASAKPVSFEADAGGEFYVPEYDPELGYASGGLVPRYAMGGTLPYGGGPGGGGYIPEELLQPQQIQGLPRDNEQLKAAGAKATAGGSGGLGDVMKAGNLGYKLAPESLKTSIKSMLPGATPSTPAAGLGAAAETAPIAAANAAAPAAEAAAGLGAAAPAAEAAAGLGAAAAPAAEIAGLGAAAAPAAEAAAALPALLGAGEAAALGGTAAAGLGSAATAASAAAPLAAAGAEGLTALLAFLPFLSDRRAKENIEPIGKTYDGQTIYRYNYKGDDRTQVGLIAQEVEKRHKDAVGSSGGMKTVDYKRATEDAADRGHFYNGGVIPFRRGYADGMTVDEADLPAIGAQDVSRSGPSDEEYAIRTIAAEMGGRSPEEARGIAAVIENRLKSGRFGEGYKGVVTARNQFEPWNNPQGPNYPMRFADDSPRMQMARAAFEARGDDPTGGALHFYAPAAQAILAQTKGDRAAVPSWARGREATDIGPTRFVRGVDGAPRPPKNMPPTEEAGRPPANIPSGAGPAADQAIAVARQPSAVVAPKKDDGSFPIRPPATAKGKEQDWSDFLTSRQFILPALTAIGTMGTTPTRDFGTALSAGLLGGVKSYQDLDKTLVGQELEGRKVSATEQTTRTAVFTKNMELLELLNRRAAAFRGRGQAIPSELANQIRDVTKQLTESGAGQSLASSAAALTPQGRQGIQQGATAAGRVEVTPPEEKKPTTEAPSSAVPSNPAAEKPAPEIPTINQALSVPSSGMADSDFQSKLDPDFNPIELNKRAREMAEYDPAASRVMFERATALQQEMNRTGFGTAMGGGVVPIPGHADEKVLRDAAPKMHESFEQQAVQYRERQLAKEQLTQIAEALSRIQSGKGVSAINEFVAGMKTAGFDDLIPESPIVNPKEAQKIAKLAWEQVFSRLKQIGGQPRVLEMQGLQASGAGLNLEPEANKAILALALAQFNYEDKFFEDAVKEYKEKGYKFTEAGFMPEWRRNNRLREIQDEVEKTLAIRGATPTNSNGSINFNGLKDGYTYVIEPGQMPGVTKPTKYRVGRDKDGKRGFEEVR